MRDDFEPIILLRLAVRNATNPALGGTPEKLAQAQTALRTYMANVRTNTAITDRTEYVRDFINKSLYQEGYAAVSAWNKILAIEGIGEGTGDTPEARQANRNTRIQALAHKYANAANTRNFLTIFNPDGTLKTGLTMNPDGSIDLTGTVGEANVTRAGVLYGDERPSGSGDITYRQYYGATAINHIFPNSILRDPNPAVGETIIPFYIDFGSLGLNRDASGATLSDADTLAKLALARLNPALVPFSNGPTGTLFRGAAGPGGTSVWTPFVPPTPLASFTFTLSGEVPARRPYSEPIFDEQGNEIGVKQGYLDPAGEFHVTSSEVTIYDRDEHGIIKLNAAGQKIELGRSTIANGMTVDRMYRFGTRDVISVDIKIPGNPIGIEFSDAGAIIGSTLGYRLANGNVIAGVVFSAALKTLGNNLGDVLDGIVTGHDAYGNIASTRDIVDTAFSEFGDELLTNLKQAGIGAISSFLTAQLVSVLGVKGFAAELTNTVAGSVINTIISNIAGLNPGASIANPFAGIGSMTALPTAVAAFIGNKLANEVISFNTIGGQIGSSIGSALGVIGGIALAKSLGMLGAFAGPIGALVGAFLGTILGGLIGSLFGGTPRSGADVAWDERTGQFTVANIYAQKGGSKQAAEGLATSVAGTLNAVLNASGARLEDPASVQSGNYGMRASNFVYRPVSSRDKHDITATFKGKDGFKDLVNYGVTQALSDSDFKLIGGSVIIKRAIYNTIDTAGGSIDLEALMGNIESATSYELYRIYAPIIGAMVSAEPGSAFALETALTLARADELGLTRRARSDWFGGYTSFLGERDAIASQVGFGFELGVTADGLARVIATSDWQYYDTIDTAGLTTIQAGNGADVVDLRTGKLANQIGYTVDGHLNNDIAVSGADFTAQALTAVSFAAAELRTSVSVALANDGLAEEAEKFLARLSAGTGVTIVGGAAEATIVDGTAAKPTLMVGRSYAGEDDGYAVFRLSLSKAAAGAVSVNLATAGINATSGTDFGAGIEVSADGLTGWTSASSITFGSGVTQYFARVAVTPDNGLDEDGEPTSIEGNERFTLTATVTTDPALIANLADTATGLVAVSATGTIIDASGGTTPYAWIDSVTVDEATGLAVFSIARSRAGTAASLSFSTADRTELTIDIAATVDGGDGDDIIHASNLGDNVFGAAGNDTLYGGRLDDWLLGGLRRRHAECRLDGCRVAWRRRQLFERRRRQRRGHRPGRLRLAGGRSRHRHPRGRRRRRYPRRRRRPWRYHPRRAGRRPIYLPHWRRGQHARGRRRPRLGRKRADHPGHRDPGV